MVYHYAENIVPQINIFIQPQGWMDKNCHHIQPSLLGALLKLAKKCMGQVQMGCLRVLLFYNVILAESQHHDLPKVEP